MADVYFREKLLQCLGGPWPEKADLKPHVKEAEQQEGYRIETLTYEVEPGDAIPALLLVPDGVNAQNSAPAVAIWHQHGGQYHLGKSEPAGLAGNPMHHTGVALVKEGYVVLCPDALCFEERRDPTGKLDNMAYERFEFLRYVMKGKSMAWKNILDMQRAIDFLCSRPEVNENKIGCYGHSMGSTHTWLIGPWEERIKCLVGNCCLPTYRGIHREHMLHCFPNFVPGLEQYGDTPDIAALIAPRPLHLNFGETDSGTPAEDIPWSTDIIRNAYESQHAEKNFSVYIQPATGHVLSDEMWIRTRDWFAKHLG
ncbi:Abhydrolase family protein [Polystyrenella longa]|uniref:Abhydrolase family protein n=1 Tax=Polystyrenella longa TaxID=2528007 RepID=A0A518CU00_9PLAN|nr:alpha/beta hydrolase family protein [Polystyrenella longa]QDU82702.1 Abhydrolase family protein [Polystyrenella longa]